MGSCAGFPPFMATSAGVLGRMSMEEAQFSWMGLGDGAAVGLGVTRGTQCSSATDAPTCPAQSTLMLCWVQGGCQGWFFMLVVLQSQGTALAWAGAAAEVAVEGRTRLFSC